MKFENYKRYVIIYQKKIGYHNFTEPELIDSDDKQEFDSLLEMSKDTYDKVFAVDTNKWYVIYNTLVVKNESDPQYNNWVALETYFGDGKTYEDFMDMEKYKQLCSQDPDSWQVRQYVWKATWKYQDYLKSQWRRKNKKEKKLPKLQIYDSSFMNQNEIDGIKQVEKDKLETIRNKSGW